jgi:hypothetical protein
MKWMEVTHKDYWQELDRQMVGLSCHLFLMLLLAQAGRNRTYWVVLVVPGKFVAFETCVCVFVKRGKPETKVPQRWQERPGC